MTLVVSDTSPIRALSHLNLLDLLGHLFGRVLIPPAVEMELEHPKAAFEPIELRRFAFMEMASPQREDLIRSFEVELHRAESEAIALALERHAVLLIDETAGRAVAARIGVARIGVLGILAAAKKQKRIAAVAPLLDRLQTELRFFISPELRHEILRDVGEK